MIIKADESNQSNLHSTYDKFRKYSYLYLFRYDLFGVDVQKFEGALITTIDLLFLDFDYTFIKFQEELKKYFLRHYFKLQEY